MAAIPPHAYGTQRWGGYSWPIQNVFQVRLVHDP